LIGKERHLTGSVQNHEEVEVEKAFFIEARIGQGD